MMNAPAPTHPSGSENRHARKLHLRQARFTGAQLPRSSTSHAASPNSSDDDLQQAEITSDGFSFSSPLATPTFRHEGSVKLKESFTPEPLRDTTNRTRKHCQYGLVSPPSSSTIDTSHTRDNRYDPDTEIFKMGHQSSQSNSSKPLSRRHQRIRPKASVSRRREVSSEMQYIEHLESQIASLQTQLQAVTSPTSSKSQSVKLRLLHEENEMLQRELTDWETKFAERLQDQIGRHERATDHMRARILDLEYDVAQRDRRMAELEAASKEQYRELEAVEGANCELERRLEFMSNLVANSPGKLNLHTPNPDQRRKRASFELLKCLGNGPTSPSRIDFHTFDMLSPVSPAPMTSRSWSNNETAMDVSRDSGYSTDVPADLSDAIIDPENSSSEAAPTPSRRCSLLRGPSGGTETDSSRAGKPTRRMRRFYAGSARQSLILPSTTTATGSQPSSAVEEKIVSIPLPSPPVSTTSFASLKPTSGVHKSHASLSATSIEDTPLHRKPRISNRRRSSTWGNSSASTIVKRQNDPSQGSNSEASPSRLSSLSSGSQLESYSKSRNLFEELSKLKEDRDTIRLNLENGTVTAPLEALHTTPPTSRSLPDELDNANSETSSLAEPSNETQVDPPSHEYCAKERPLQAKNVSDSTPLNPKLTLLPPTLRTILRLVFHPLTPCLPILTSSAKQLFSHAWESLTLSRPVLEFRVWLVTLLLGRLRHKHGAILVLKRPYPPPIGPSCVGSALNLFATGKVHTIGLGAADCQPQPDSLKRDNLTKSVEYPGTDDTPKAQKTVESSLSRWQGTRRVDLKQTQYPVSPPQGHAKVTHDGLDVLSSGEVVIANVPGCSTSPPPTRCAALPPPSFCLNASATDDMLTRNTRPGQPSLAAGSVRSLGTASAVLNASLEQRGPLPQAFPSHEDKTLASELGFSEKFGDLTNTSGNCRRAGDQDQGPTWGGSRTLTTQPEAGLAPASSWLKFSATMVTALGIAVLDGPGALFEK